MDLAQKHKEEINAAATAGMEEAAPASNANKAVDVLPDPNAMVNPEAYPDETSFNGSIHDEVESVASESSRDEVQEIRHLMRRETKGVILWRFIVLLVMILISVLATVATFRFLKEEEKADFESAYDQFATTIIESSSLNARFIQDSYQTFADYITAYAMDDSNDESWPFVTVPNFLHHGENIRKQTSSYAILMAHDVEASQKGAWENYTQHNNAWLGDSYFIPMLFSYYPNATLRFDIGNGPYRPMWQTSPLPFVPLSNLDAYPAQPQAKAVDKLGHAIFGRLAPSDDISFLYPAPEGAPAVSYKGEPYSTYFQPIYNVLDDMENSINAVEKKRVAFMTGIIRVGLYFNNLLPQSVKGIHVVVDTNACNESFTWEIQGSDAVFLGNEDLHDKTYDEYRLEAPFGNYDDPKSVEEAGACVFTVNVYPTKIMEEEYETTTPAVATALVAVVFAFMIGSFFAFDAYQRRRTEKVVANAARSNAVVSSLFPDMFRDRVLGNDTSTTEELTEDVEHGAAKKKKKKRYYESDNRRIQDFLTNEGNEDTTEEDPNGGQSARKPMADLFLDTTVIFADVVGFTAWSSQREPSQVFTLLEALFSKFDELAKPRRVFKVETVGDCYVAVAGLPSPREDHAVLIARFAHAVRLNTNRLMKQLERTLGPDTGDLQIRIGIHSGPVTAGVLRGERQRFQLFGDTMNTTARMESTGKPNQIHISKETAQALIAQNKAHWVEKREDPVDIKGKGSVETYWLNVKSGRSASLGTAITGGSDEKEDAMGGALKKERLIDWQVDVFARLLKQIVSLREAQKSTNEKRDRTPSLDGMDRSLSEVSVDRTDYFALEPGKTCLDEVKEIIELPRFDPRAARKQQNPEDMVLSEEVREQLRDYISCIAAMYQPNAFHNFEHACHVSMSVTKLLSRIVMPSDLLLEEEDNEAANPTDGQIKKQIAAQLHDHTYGITSDPLTQFAVVFSALIHDVDHMGVPNTQLAKENPDMAMVFKEQSVAEQNSIVLALELLMDDCYGALRDAICESKEEKARFRQLVFQTVLATDIADKELKVLRNARWENAFSGREGVEEDPRDNVNRKATIVIEHLIQASDVAHTMQHWHVYRRWNENFFRECYQAWKDGRADKDPSEFWYKGEIGFFDFYIIPLARKLKECGVFGKSSDEYLNYALTNRQEWEERGQEVVAEMLEASKTGTSYLDTVDEDIEDFEEEHF